MKKKRLLFDIAPFGHSHEMAGILRVSCEVLKRLLDRDDFEIVLICSSKEEESAWRNANRVLGLALPFYSHQVENYVLPEQPTPVPIPPKSLLKRLEECVRFAAGDNRLVKHGIETARKIKWFFRPPPLPPEEKERPRSSLLEKLVRESDAYFTPYHAIIPEADVHPAMEKFQILYDIIPTLFPQWYPLEVFPWERIAPDTTIFSISEYTKKDYLQTYPDAREERITVIPLAASSAFAPCSDRNKIDTVLKKYGISPSDPYILSVAALEIRKNLDHVIRSFGRLIKEHGSLFPDLKLVLTGKKAWRGDKIRQAFKQMPRKIRKRIHFTGYVADEDLPLLYNGASCFCYMSIYEGFGLPPLEAMQSGTPVIVSNISSLPEVVGEAGILLNPYDEAALAGALKQVLGDEKLREDMKRCGLVRAEKFNWDRCAEIILKSLRRSTES